MKFSIIIPAHNEECFIERCLDSISQASGQYPSEVEVIVVLNRCNDGTEQIARARGARVIANEDKNLARIRNAGARLATGEILVTIDADSWMSGNMLFEIEHALKSGKYIGGGVPIIAERMSAGIWCTLVVLKTLIFFAGLSGGLYWCYRRDFESIGGFNEELLVAEDLNFAKRLKEYGRVQGKKFITLPGVHITTSCRKFDFFGDWFFFKQVFSNRNEVRNVFRGKGAAFANRYFYDFEHPRKSDKI